MTLPDLVPGPETDFFNCALSARLWDWFIRPEALAQAKPALSCPADELVRFEPLRREGFGVLVRALGQEVVLDIVHLLRPGNVWVRACKLASC